MDKFIQFIYLYTPQVSLQELPLEQLYESETERGEGGFGSTN